MMKPPKGMLNRITATTSRALNSKNLRVVVHGHLCQPSFWSAKYNHQDGTNAINPMARNHRTSEATTALVQVHSNSRTTAWNRSTWGLARSCSPRGTSLIASFTDPVLRGEIGPDYIGRPSGRSARRPGRAGGLSGLSEGLGRGSQATTPPARAG